MKLRRLTCFIEIRTFFVFIQKPLIHRVFQFMKLLHVNILICVRYDCTYFRYSFKNCY